MAALALGCAVPAMAQPADGALGDPPPVGLLTSLPLYWGEADTLAERLRGTVPVPPARRTIERRYALVPLDVLATGDDPDPAGGGPLSGLDRLIVAQPRALTARENVALDAWVRGGGRLLVFADPLLTGDSRFGFGDRRRPVAVALLGPILAHWGLDLGWRPGEGTQTVDMDGVAVPVDERGRWIATGPDPAEPAGTAAGAECAIGADGLVARCRIGAGQALLVADAALLGGADPEAADAALEALLARAFETR